MAALIQTIAVVDKSGKAVSTSKHLVNVFKEAKAAYLERKAEVVAGRHYGIEEKNHRKALKGAAADDNRHAASRTHSGSHRGSSKPSSHHRHSGSSVPSESNSIYPSSHNRHSQDLSSPRSQRSPTSPRSPTFKPEALVRRHSARDDEYDLPRPGQLVKRSMTSPMASPSHIDMDLAYGPIPPPLPVARTSDEAEFKGLVQKVKRILEEADCLQHSAAAIITTLQKNPDAMAAVALTLAEISNIVRKMAPGVLTAMKGSSPAVFALLASPQFLIAGGVAVGVTIVAFGGFKIIKKIQAKNAIEQPGMDEMVEIGGDVNRINNWRRGIAEEQEQSVGTSVDGEFITPHAAALSKLNLDETTSSELRRKDVGSGSKKTNSSKSGSEKGCRTSSKASSKASSKGKKETKVKKPSPLRLMFS